MSGPLRWAEKKKLRQIRADQAREESLNFRARFADVSTARANDRTATSKAPQDTNEAPGCALIGTPAQHVALPGGASRSMPLMEAALLEDLDCPDSNLKLLQAHKAAQTRVESKPAAHMSRSAAFAKK
ncbi:hypothetical protein CYMTET_39386, partial [Cymbomonas tetramitiformis]